MADAIDELRPVESPGPRQIRMATRRSLPVVAISRPAIPAAAVERIERLATRLRSDEPALGDSAGFGAAVRAGLATDGYALAFEDRAGTALSAARGPSPTEYRARLLAGSGDFVALHRRPDPEFDRYCRDTLGLGQVEMLRPAPDPAPNARLPLRLLRDGATMARLCEAARRDRVISLLPYRGDGAAWLLGRDIAERTGAEVLIAAAPPRLARRVNDKLWFAERVGKLLGTRALPPTCYAYGPAALAARLQMLARHSARVVVKIPDSAGAFGNLSLDGATVLSMPLHRLRRRLIGALRGLTWNGAWPLLVGVWDSTVIASPSVQCWIPEPAAGPTIVEAVFEQRLEGVQGAFVGAAPSALPDAWTERLAGEAAILGGLLQRLGYYGRCSFDAVLSGSSQATAKLHWIECNGRWGGVSIPMTLANRLIGDWRCRPFVVVQRETPQMPPLTVSRAVELLGNRLFRPGGTKDGVVLLTPHLMKTGRGMHFMALARNAADAWQSAREAAAILSGTS